MVYTEADLFGEEDSEDSVEDLTVYILRCPTNGDRSMFIHVFTGLDEEADVVITKDIAGQEFLFIKEQGFYALHPAQVQFLKWGYSEFTVDFCLKLRMRKICFYSMRKI